MFTKSTDVHSYNTRSSSKGNFDVKFCKSRQRSFCASIIGAKLWNQLDITLRTVPSLSLFRFKLRKHFLRNY